MARDGKTGWTCSLIFQDPAKKQAPLGWALARLGFPLDCPRRQQGQGLGGLARLLQIQALVAPAVVEEDEAHADAAALADLQELILIQSSVRHGATSSLDLGPQQKIACFLRIFLHGECKTKGPQESSRPKRKTSFLRTASCSPEGDPSIPFPWQSARSKAKHEKGELLLVTPKWVKTPNMNKGS